MSRRESDPPIAGKQGGMDGCSTKRKAEEAPAAGCSAGEKPTDAAAVASGVSDSEGKESASPELATGVSDGENPVDVTAAATATGGDEEENETPIPQGKYRLAKAAVEQILAHKRTPFVVSDKIVNPDARRLLLEAAAAHEEFEDNYPAFQAQIREEYEANGFVALPDNYEEIRAEINASGEAIFLKILGPPADESDEEDYYNEEELAAMRMRRQGFQKLNLAEEEGA